MDRQDVLFLGSIFLAIVFVMCTFCYLGAMIENSMMLDSRIAKIEQCRQDVANVPSFGSEDLIGRAGKWNEWIVSRRVYNTKWWACALISNEWDSVKLIEMPHD